MNTIKSALARSAIVVAFVLSGCASVGQSESVHTPFESTQYGGF